MDYDGQLKLQALLDGELPEGEAKKVAALASQDPEAAALLEELRHTRSAFAAYQEGLKLPESREFFWSKIEREIRRSEAPGRTPAPSPALLWLRRLLVPACALAAVVVGGVFLIRPSGVVQLGPPAGIETALADSGAFTYRDFSAGTTLVWLSYPAENEVAEDDEMNTLE